MKDLLNREIEVGHYIAYALSIGRSAEIALYKVVEVNSDKIKAIKLNSSYSFRNSPLKYKKWDRKLGEYIEISAEERHKIDNKTSTLSMPERVFILNEFTPNILSKE